MSCRKVLKFPIFGLLVVALAMPSVFGLTPSSVAAQSVRQGPRTDVPASFDLPRVRVQYTQQQMAEAVGVMRQLSVGGSRAGGPGQGTVGVQPQNPDGGPSEYVPACKPGQSSLLTDSAVTAWELGCEPGAGPVPGGAGPLPYYIPSGSIPLSTMSCTYTFFPGDAFAGPAHPGCPPYDRYELKPSGLINLYPWRTDVKIFFKNAAYSPTGGVFVCSGKVIATGVSGHRSLVLTAGHCVNSGGREIGPNEYVEGTWSTGVLVCPAWYDGPGPFGCWQGQQLFALQGWFLKSNLRRDVGMIVTHLKDGNRIADVTGAMGIGWNLSRIQTYNIQGYPHAAPFNGQRKTYCKSVRFRDDLRLDVFFPDLGPTTLSAGCDQTGGTSGGGWVIDWVGGTARFNRNPFILSGVWRVGGIVNSVSSYRWISPFEPDALQGPYFGTSVRNLWNAARVVVPLPPPGGGE